MRHIKITLNADEKRKFNISGYGFSVNEINPFNARVYVIPDYKNNLVKQLIGRNLKYPDKFKSFEIINVENYSISIDFYIIETYDEFQSLNEPSLQSLTKVDTRKVTDLMLNAIRNKKGWIYEDLELTDTKFIFDNYELNDNYLFYITQLSVQNLDTSNSLTLELLSNVDYSPRTHTVSFKFHNKYISDTIKESEIPIIKDISAGYVSGTSIAKFIIPANSSFKLTDYLNLPIIIPKNKNICFSFTDSTNYRFLIDFFSELL